MTSDRLSTESRDYRKLRAELLDAEIALKDQIERVAALRRRLPGDTPVDDYVLQCVDVGDDAAPRSVRLSELFSARDRTLVLVHFMFGKAQKEPCPMCTMWADGYDGAVPHLKQRIDFGVVVAGDLDAFRTYGRARGWRHLRLLSAAGSTFKRDLLTEDDEGGQTPAVSAFRLAPDGGVRHTYTQGAMMGGGHFRGMDLLSPVWSFLDLTPEGRGDWFPSVRYDE